MHKKLEVYPDYYKAFCCIQGNCTFTCCQEWSIEGVDGRTISLNEDHKCPHLTREGLCSVVVKEGEMALSLTCHLFPRQKETYALHTEYSLSPCCPAVLELLHETDPFQMEKEMEGVIRQYQIKDTGQSYDLKLRKDLMELMQNPEIDLKTELLTGFYILLSLQEEAENRKLSYWFDPERIREIASQIQGMDYHFEDTLYERNELFLDMIENYRSKRMYQKQLVPLEERAEQLETELEKDNMGSVSQWEVYEHQSSTEDRFYRNYVTAELFSFFTGAKDTLKEQILSYQWIMLEYALLRHGNSLRQNSIDTGSSLIWEEARDQVALLSRIMGYGQEDRMEYLKEHFKNAFWEWGYAALIL